MKNKVTRTSLNADLHQKVDEEINQLKKMSKENMDKLNKIKTRLNIINPEYFEELINEINETVSINSLYNNPTLSDDMNFSILKTSVKRYLEDVSVIIDKKLEVIEEIDIFNLDDNEVSAGVRDKIEDLAKQVKNLKSLKDLNENLTKKFDDLNPNASKSLLIIDRKFENETDNGGIEYSKRVEISQKNNYQIIKNIKKLIDDYKIKWIWYIVAMAVLVVAAILCIIIPIFVS